MRNAHIGNSLPKIFKMLYRASLYPSLEYTEKKLYPLLLSCEIERVFSSLASLEVALFFLETYYFLIKYHKVCQANNQQTIEVKKYQL
jgi:hypothetical protein